MSCSFYAIITAFANFSRIVKSTVFVRVRKAYSKFYSYGSRIERVSILFVRLASLLSHKWGDEYSSVMGWLRCSLSFSLLRSAIQCIRGARSSIGHYVSAPPPMDLVRVESNLTIDSNDTRR